VALLLGHEAAVVLASDLGDLVLEAGEDLLLVSRRHDVVLRDRDARPGREAERDRLDDVERRGNRVRTVVLDEVADERVQLTLAEGRVEERMILEVAPRRLVERTLDLGVEDDPARCGDEELVTPRVLDRILEVDGPRLDGELDVLLRPIA